LDFVGFSEEKTVHLYGERLKSRQNQKDKAWFFVAVGEYLQLPSYMVGVAQLVEPRIVIPVVVGSIPIAHPSL
jgi:hypothetical protein